MAAPNAVFFARNRCLTRLCDVYDAQTTIRNSAHHDIRRIRVPLHAELRRGKAERRGLGVAGKPATFKQASEGSGKRVTINFRAACGTKLCLDSAQNGTVIPGGVSTFRQHTMLNDGTPVAPTRL